MPPKKKGKALRCRAAADRDNDPGSDDDSDSGSDEAYRPPTAPAAATSTHPRRSRRNGQAGTVEAKEEYVEAEAQHVSEGGDVASDGDDTGSRRESGADVPREEDIRRFGLDGNTIDVSYQY